MLSHTSCLHGRCTAAVVHQAIRSMLQIPIQVRNGVLVHSLPLRASTACPAHVVPVDDLSSALGDDCHEAMFAVCSPADPWAVKRHWDVHKHLLHLFIWQSYSRVSPRNFPFLYPVPLGFQCSSTNKIIIYTIILPAQQTQLHVLATHLPEWRKFEQVFFLYMVGYNPIICYMNPKSIWNFKILSACPDFICYRMEPISSLFLHRNNNPNCTLSLVDHFVSIMGAQVSMPSLWG